MDRGRVGEAYNICGPTHTLVEAFRIAGEVAGRRAPIAVPPAALRALIPVTGMLGRVLPIPAQYAPESLAVTAGVTYIGTNARARRELGFDPRPLADGWAETVRHELARGAA